ncbi:MAG TPA: diaminopimelate epimerase [Bryobacteraceae bacterium]|jgi:diaminopimelate epimerase|nr:diaminopimelate epimerase [Bryobacteraceae bacterium]
MNIPFTKAHGARNDFLLTWRDQLPSGFDSPAAAIAICNRHTGAGADGWLLVSETPSIELWNSDGSRSEISGNGTRCAAAFLVEAGRASNDVQILTGAGPKHLRLLARDGRRFSFEMNMGAAVIEQLRTTILDYDATILNVGNPQCAVFVEHFDFDWRSLGAEIERHWQFPNRTNVSFIKRMDEHTLDVRFFERGAGETMSSGTGSTGAAAAAHARGLVLNPVRVLTPAGPLDLRWENRDILLAGPAEIVASGEFYWDA